MKELNSITSKARVGGHFIAECYRDGKLLWKDETHNIWTNEGLDSLLNVYFHGSTQITTWYCALFESNTTPAAGTTYATPVFTECTAYDEATRPAYTVAASSSQSITNSANKATFTFNDDKTIYGAAIVGGGTAGSTKGDSAGGGTLPAAGKFGTARVVVSGDILYLTYVVGAGDDGV
jgi:hypothetical protein